MAYKIVIKQRFLNNLSKVLTYLEHEWNAKVADDLLNKVDMRINALETHPFIGAPTKIKNIRGIHITKHNRMYYKVNNETVIIMNLYDTRRKTYS